MPLPTEKTVAKKDPSDFSYLIYGAPGVGKCLSGDTLLMNPKDGGFSTLKEVVENKLDVYTYNTTNDDVICKTPIRWLKNPKVDLFRLVTISGREICASGEHKFLTENGQWKTLNELSIITDRVAILADYIGTVRNNTEDDIFLNDGFEETGFNTLIYKDLSRLDKIKLLNRCARKGIVAVAYGGFVNIFYHRMPNSRLVYDKIVSINYHSTEESYDLEIPDTHNYIAQDFVVHNSTFASHFPDALFLATEPGLKSLTVYRNVVTSWEMFLKDCKDIAAGKHPFKTIVIDTVDNLYKFCSEFKCDKLQIEHESDLPWGKGFDLVNAEFQRVINRLSQLPYGLVFISHAVEKEVETRTGKSKKIVPSLPKGPHKFITSFVDMMLYFDVEAVKEKDQGGNISYRRVIRAKPTPIYEAKDRTNLLPDSLPMSYDSFVKEFDKVKGEDNE